MPNYTVLESKVSVLKDMLLVLKNTPTSANLLAAQNDFLEAYKAWQKVSPFQFGPAVDIALNTINIYPTDTARINNNIASGVYNLDAASNIVASGFPALDYILFFGTEPEILARLSNAATANYMMAVVEQMNTKVSSVKSTWQSTYSAKFIAATGNAVGSSLSQLTNAMILNYEKDAREAKIGIPAGVRTLNQAIPEKVEALYCKKSILLAKEHLEGYKDIFEGKNGESFKTILTTLGKETLANNISAHLVNVSTSLNTLTDPFDQMLINSNAPALATYGEYQKMLPLLKVDMTATLGLLITYSDSDGD